MVSASTDTAHKTGEDLEIAGHTVRMLTHTATFSAQRCDQVAEVVDGIALHTKRQVVALCVIGNLVPAQYLATLGGPLPSA